MKIKKFLSGILPLIVLFVFVGCQQGQQQQAVVTNSQRQAAEAMTDDKIALMCNETDPKIDTDGIIRMASQISCLACPQRHAKVTVLFAIGDNYWFLPITIADDVTNDTWHQVARIELVTKTLINNQVNEQVKNGKEISPVGFILDWQNEQKEDFSVAYYQMATEKKELSGFLVKNDHFSFNPTPERDGLATSIKSSFGGDPIKISTKNKKSAIELGNKLPTLEALELIV